MLWPVSATYRCEDVRSISVGRAGPSSAVRTPAQIPPPPCSARWQPTELSGHITNVGDRLKRDAIEESPIAATIDSDSACLMQSDFDRAARRSNRSGPDRRRRGSRTFDRKARATQRNCGDLRPANVRGQTRRCPSPAPGARCRATCPDDQRVLRSGA